MNETTGKECPICEEGCLQYKPIKNPKATGENREGENVTHLWFCDECPAIVAEWYDKEDSRSLGKL